MLNIQYMKMTSKLNKLHYIIFSGLFLMGMSACSEKKDDAMIGDGETVIKVNVNVLETQNPTTSITRAASGGGVMKAEIPTSAKIKSTEAGFDVITSMHAIEGYAEEPSARASTTNKKALSSVAETPTPLASDTKYRLIVYEASDASHANPIANVVASSGTSPNLKIDAGKSYNWFALSINDKTAVPDVTNGVVEGSNLKGKDVLLANGSLTTQSGENFLDINFKHNTSRIDVSFDSRGMFGGFKDNLQLADFASSQANGNTLLQYGDLNLFTGAYSNVQNYNSSEIVPLVEEIPGYGKARMTYSFYTINNTLNVAANSLQANLKNIQIDKQSGYNNTATVVFPNAVTKWDNTGFTAKYGSTYTFTYTLVESVLTGPSPSGWARTNLVNNTMMANPRGGLNIPGLAPVSTDFFKGPLTSDPCNEVYPKGKWRLPNQLDLQLFTTYHAFALSRATAVADGAQAGPNTGLFGIAYSQEQNPKTYYPALSQRLFLPFAGYISLENPAEPKNIEGGYSITSNSAPQKVSGRYWYKKNDGTYKLFIIDATYSNGTLTIERILRSDVTPEANAMYSVRCKRAN